MLIRVFNVHNLVDRRFSRPQTYWSFLLLVKSMLHVQIHQMNTLYQKCAYKIMYLRYKTTHKNVYEWRENPIVLTLKHLLWTKSLNINFSCFCTHRSKIRDSRIMLWLFQTSTYKGYNYFTEMLYYSSRIWLDTKWPVESKVFGYWEFYEFEKGLLWICSAALELNHPADLAGKIFNQ